MRKYLLIILVLILLGGCEKAPIIEESKCWEKVYSNDAFAFVVVAINLCDGRVMTHSITPIQEYMDRMEKKNDLLRAKSNKKRLY